MFSSDAPFFKDEDLENEADAVTQRYDPERLWTPKPIDVYDVIDTILGVPYEMVYLTPDQSYLGLTGFHDFYWWCWPVPYYEPKLLEFLELGWLTDDDYNYLPQKRLFEKGTILIEKTLSSPKSSFGRHIFTVMHEVFHHLLHWEFFETATQIHYSTNETFSRINSGYRTLIEPIDFVEHQASYAAAAFLMPRSAVKNVCRERIIHRNDYRTINELACMFSVSTQAMSIRLDRLGLYS